MLIKNDKEFFYMTFKKSVSLYILYQNEKNIGK